MSLSRYEKKMEDYSVKITGEMEEEIRDIIRRWWSSKILGDKCAQDIKIAVGYKTSLTWKTFLGGFITLTAAGGLTLGPFGALFGAVAGIIPKSLDLWHPKGLELLIYSSVLPSNNSSKSTILKNTYAKMGKASNATDTGIIDTRKELAKANSPSNSPVEFMNIETAFAVIKAARNL